MTPKQRKALTEAIHVIIQLLSEETDIIENRKRGRPKVREAVPENLEMIGAPVDPEIMKDLKECI